jgi:hypothetical protein
MSISMIGRCCIALSAVCVLRSCAPDPGGAVITVRLADGNHRLAVIETLPVAGGQVRVLDSARLASNDALLTFRLPVTEQTVCRLHVPGSEFSVPFVLHPGPIHIEGNVILPPGMASVRSAVNTVHDAFLDRQAEGWQLAAERRELAEQEGDPALRASLQRAHDSLRSQLAEDALRYADSVPHPGAFLHAYGYLDFGRDRPALKAFVRRAATRFPAHAGVARLQARILAYLETFEFEYEVGDRPPRLSLPDAMGRRVTVPDTGRHLLVGFWSTWSNPAIDLLDAERRLQPWLATGRLGIVNIALDGEVDTWSFLTATRRLPGLQLIDTGVWEGPVIRQWRIDSVPFTWLMGPDGRILRKAVPADSLYEVVRRTLGGSAR